VNITTEAVSSDVFESPRYDEQPSTGVSAFSDVVFLHVNDEWFLVKEH